MGIQDEPEQFMTENKKHLVMIESIQKKKKKDKKLADRQEPT